MILPTDLTHIATYKELQEILDSNENVVICCGRMGPMCIPVYGHMKELEESGEYEHVTFRDMAFDNPEAAPIRNHDRCKNFMGLPFTVYYKNGEMVHATSSIQSKEEVVANLNQFLTA